ncbi:ABC transporter permease [Roseomonas gilardii]|uniref:ABC transporter permease n=1 Tax=Roseomonas gilardii TaxID=257708 RepID=UPI0011A5FFA8|nr:ABC transporter permease [Roseomonas gilardii]
MAAIDTQSPPAGLRAGAAVLASPVVPVAPLRARRGAGWPLGALPAGLFVGVLLLVPLLWLTWVSLHRGDMVTGLQPGLTFANYAKIFTVPTYAEALWGTLRLSVLVTLVTLLVGYPVALFIARSRSRLVPLTVAVVALPLFVSVVVRSFGWMVLLARTGPVSSLLAALGLTGGPVRLLNTEGAVLVGLVHILLPLMVLPIAAVLRNIDRQLDEAAESLGASRLRVLLTVIVPLSLPGIGAGCLLVMAHGIAAFVLPALLGADRVKLMATMIQQQTMVVGDVPFGAALSLVMLLAAFALLGGGRLLATRMSR